MQAPSMLAPGTEVRITFSNGETRMRTIVEWGEQGIVTATEFHIHFTPFHRINRITIDKEDASTNAIHDERLVAAGT